jgi:signal transduction histidine kinase/ActR/RegA family two-component response regulator
MKLSTATGSGTGAFFLFLVAVFYAIDIAAQQSAPRAEHGVLDLRGTAVSTQNVALKGEWRLYWNKLLSPGDTAGPSEYVDFPKLWTKTEWKNQPLPSQGYATYTLDVLLPADHVPLALDIPHVYTAYRLYANGQLLADNGRPGTSRSTTEPHWSQRVEHLPVGEDTLRLVLQMANFQHAKGGPFKDIVLGPRDALLHAQHAETSFDIFLAGCLFMGGLFFIGLFVFGRHDQTLLYFSLFALLYSYRIVGTKNYALHLLFPELPWSLTLHCEYLSLYLSIAMFVMYTWKLYPQDVYKPIIRPLVGVCLAFALATVLLPTELFTRLVVPFLGVMLVGIPYAASVYWRAYRNRRTGARFAVMSTGALMLVFVSILLEYFDMAAPSKFFLFVGYLGFFFLQSLILSYRFAWALKKAKEDAEKGLRAKSEFLSTMSHEIRTPLNSVIGMTHLLLKDEPRPEQKEHLDALYFSANNLLSIVNDILDYNKIEADKINFVRGPVDLVRICQNTVSGYSKLAADAGISLRLVLDPALTSRVIGDHTRTSQVIGNLVQNAIKFTPKGSVTLRVEVQGQTEEDISLNISVEDTGIGIAPEKQKEIFERFTQVDSSVTRVFSGTGLGLAISKKILALQQVDLKLISEPGVGSTFYFVQTFPKAEPEAQPVPVADVSLTEKPLEDIQVLIVEDNKMNIMVAEKFLKRWGAHTEVALNGREALDKLDATRHELVLMDLHMPVMDGYEATRQLRERGETLPIIALTASIAQESQSKIYSNGFNDIVVKPFNPDDLLRAILTYVKPKVK